MHHIAGGTDRSLAAWGSSALVITDSRVSFSDARICCDGIAVRDPSIVLNVGPILDALAAFAGG